MKKVIPFLLVYLFFSKPAYAYLDPGTLTILATSLASAVAAIGAFFSSIKRKYKKMVNYFFNKKLPKN